MSTLSTRPGDATPSVLLLGDGWFPDRLGGLNRYARQLVEGLPEHGVEVRAVIAGPALDAPLGVNAVGASTLPRRAVEIARRARTCGRGASVIDVHFPLYAAPALMLSSLRRKPLVAHFHGPWADESAVSGEGAIRVGLKRALEQAVLNRSRSIVVLSEASKRIVVERYGAPPWKVEVMAPAVDLGRFCPGDAGQARARLDLPADCPVVLAVRRLVTRTGVAVLIGAWAEAHQLRAAGGVLVIVGEGPDREALGSLTRELGLGGAVRFTGAVDDDTLADLYRAADVSVVPSVALEGFGLVALEALASGTPALCSDEGGLPEAVRGLGGGVLVPAGDQRALTERLEAGLSGGVPFPGRERCREHAERFALSTFLERHRRLYATVATPGAQRHRVVFLDHCARLSGAELVLVRLIEAMDGVDAHVILGEDGPLVDRINDAGAAVEVLPLDEAARELRKESVRADRIGWRGPAASALYLPRLARRLRRLAPDLVHTMSLKSSLYGTVAARLARVPSVWHLHDRISSDYLPDEAATAVRFLARRAPHALIVNSRATLATVAPARVPVSVIGSPVTRATGARPPVRAVKRVGVLGRIAPWKGQHVFLQAFAHAFPDSPIEAVLVGAALFGEDAYERELRAQVRDLGLDERVDFRGFQADVGRELGRIDVLVHASTVPEPFGQAVVEGMAAGVPVVAAAAGGPGEVVTHGVDGLLYPPGDAEALSVQLRRLSADTPLRRRLASAGWERAADYDPLRIAAQVESVYAGVLDRRPVAR